jgi:hypothetical protein
MPSAEAITYEVCRGLGSSDSEKLEVHLDIRNHGLEGSLEGLLESLLGSLLEGLLDGVLGSELHPESKNTCLECDRNLGSMARHSAAIIKMSIPIEAN